MDKTVQFDFRIIKQALLDWIHSKSPVENSLAEVFEEHRVGSNDRFRIRTKLYNLLRNDSDLVVKIRSLTGIQASRALESYIQSNQSSLNTHFGLKPTFEKDPRKHLVDIHGYQLFEGHLSDQEYQDIHECLHAQRSEPVVAVRVDKKVNRPDNPTVKDLLEKGFVEHSEIKNAYVANKKSGQVRVEQISKMPGVRFQDLSSQVVACAVNYFKPGKILDYCAGSGGKTFQIVDQAESPVEVVSFDVDFKRISKLSDGVKRLNLSQVKVLTKKENLNDLRGQFDHVLVDAPCSGMGTLRRHPDLIYRQTLAEVKRIQALQLQIVFEALSFLRPGGILTYATCTFRREENENVVESLLSQNTYKLKQANQYFQNSDVFRNQVGVKKYGMLLSPNNSHDPTRSQASGAWDGDCFYIAQLQLEQ
jgi:16S rRNA C967 or C1407 C5-methylase (RsmB/RsmF family)